MTIIKANCGKHIANVNINGSMDQRRSTALRHVLRSRRQGSRILHRNDSAVCNGAVSPGPKVDQSAALKTMCGMQWGKEPYKMAIYSRHNVKKIAEGVNTRELGPIRSGAMCPT